MDAAFWWQLFLETGAPEAYVLFRRAEKRPARKPA